jgi:hypothetical protein
VALIGCHAVAPGSRLRCSGTSAEFDRQSRDAGTAP